MSRDSNGDYTLPVGNPVVTDTVIESDWANTTMNDLKASMTNSLDRQGRGGMLAALKGIDGTKTVPMYSFTNEFNSGWYRAADNDIRMSIAGNDVIIIAPTDLLEVPTFTLLGGDFTLTEGSVNVVLGTYLFDGIGLEMDGDDLYLGDKATGKKVATVGDTTAAEVSFDNTITGTIPADNVQDALDILGAGGQSYSSVPHTGGGALLAGVMNELLDGDTYDLPLASTTLVNTQIGISVPSTAAAFTPLVQIDGGDTITWEEGSDTDMLFEAPATIWLTSDGVDTWRY